MSVYLHTESTLSKIEPEVLSRRIAWLQSIDKENTLPKRVRQLAAAYEAAEMLHAPIGSQPFVEFGANHFAFPMNLQMHEPGISHFFALYAKSLGVNYHAFDRWITNNETLDTLLTQNIMTQMQRQMRGGENFTYDVSTIHKIKTGVIAANITYDQVMNPLTDNLIFSSNVLNDPMRDETYPFWQLPGTHIHWVTLSELMESTSVFTQSYVCEHAQKYGCLPQDWGSISLGRSMDQFMIELAKSEPEFVSGEIGKHLGVTSPIQLIEVEKECYVLGWRS